jgi:thiol-disulfide isomerase/thioredoxin
MKKLRAIILGVIIMGFANMFGKESFEGLVRAPEFGRGAEWLNTDKAMSLKELRGKFVLLDFWTYCCINCMHILPDLEKLEEAYPNELVVIGVHSAKFESEGETRNIAEAIARYEIRHPVVNDRDFKIWRSYAVRAWPTTVLIAPDGKILRQDSGEGVYARLKPYLDAAIPHWKAKGTLDETPFNYAEASALNHLLHFPGKIFYDDASQTLSISNSNRHQIIVADRDGKMLHIIGSGVKGAQNGRFDEAQFNQPQGVFRYKNLIYVADTKNHLIRIIDLEKEQVSTILGTGSQAQHFNQPGFGRNVAINSPWDLYRAGDFLYIAMAGFHQVWRMRLSDHFAEPFAGSGYENIIDGRLRQAQMAQPSGLSFDGEYLYVADSETSSIRKIALTDGPQAVKTLLGTGLFDFGDVDGTFPKARLQHALGVLHHKEKLYIADTYNDKIKVYDLKSGVVKQWGDLPLNEPSGLATDGEFLYITDTNNHRIVKAALADGQWQEFYLLETHTLFLNDKGIYELKIRLPQGSKLNPEVQSILALDKEKIIISDLELHIPKEKITNNLAKLNLYYCDEKDSGLCYFEEITLRFAESAHRKSPVLIIEKASMP